MKRIKNSLDVNKEVTVNFIGYDLIDAIPGNIAECRYMYPVSDITVQANFECGYEDTNRKKSNACKIWCEIPVKILDNLSDNVDYIKFDFVPYFEGTVNIFSFRLIFL